MEQREEQCLFGSREFVDGAVAVMRETGSKGVGRQANRPTQGRGENVEGWWRLEVGRGH